jgi:hypothetical protein
LGDPGDRKEHSVAKQAKRSPHCGGIVPSPSQAAQPDGRDG